jgi:hypothetical protein
MSIEAKLALAFTLSLVASGVAIFAFTLYRSLMESAAMIGAVS